MCGDGSVDSMFAEPSIQRTNLMKLEDIQLGDKARDRLSGYTGILCSVTVELSGWTRFGIQPYDDTGKTFIDAYNVDWQSLEVIEKQVVPVIEPQELSVGNGDTVTDKVSGYHGVIVTKAVHSNGCTRFKVRSKDNLGQDGMPIDVWFEPSQLEIFETSTIEVEETSTGGPSMCDNSMSRRAP